MNRVELYVDFKNKTILPSGTIELVKVDYNSTILHYNFENGDYNTFTKEIKMLYPNGNKLVVKL